MEVTQCIHRVSDGPVELFSAECYIHVHCCDASVYIPVNNILVEKLDRHVVVSSPQFTHQSNSIDNAR